MYNNKAITSSKAIARMANKYFIEKVNKIINGFYNHHVSPINILSKLIPKQQSTFKLPLITIQEMHKLINSIDKSNARGHDEITNQVIKKLYIEI